jgi:serine/threonine protein kinase
MSAANSHAPPETIGNYVIEHVLAHGSMGTVYLAHHALTYARVALKLLRAELAADAQAEERFLREVRAAARIGHDGIVKVHDAGKTSDGHLYLAMELLAGDTLEDWMAREPGDRLTAMDWLLAMLEPLAAAHMHSIVHRDLKPANVFIARAPDGTEYVKLLDFGLARDTREKSGTQTGVALGTPYYMSPEQATRPKDVSPASDVWSVGVMMYEVLSGAMPFDGETLHAVVIRAATMPHVPAASAVPGLHPELAALIDDCLAKDPAQRPHDASVLLDRLAPLLADEQIRMELSNAPVIPSQDEIDTVRPPEYVHMPFADTAIALAHDSRIQDVHPRSHRSGLAVWVSSAAALALVSAGLFWGLDRPRIEQSTDAASAGSSPLSTSVPAPATPMARTSTPQPSPATSASAPTPPPPLPNPAASPPPAVTLPPASARERSWPAARSKRRSEERGIPFEPMPEPYTPPEPLAPELDITPVPLEPIPDDESTPPLEGAQPEPPPAEQPTEPTEPPRAEQAPEQAAPPSATVPPPAAAPAPPSSEQGTLP